jgi:type IV secretory pathway VirJ component
MQTYDLAAQAVQSTLAGKGANAALNVPALLNTFGIQAGSDAVKNNQLLANYLNSAADQAASSLGLSGSDSRLAAAKAGQPDPANMNAPALLESIQHVKGLQQAVLDRQQATTNFLAQNGNNTSALPQFETKWNQSFNPDVSYVRSLGDPAAQQAALQKLKAEGKLGQWTKDYQAMKALGAF